MGIVIAATYCEFEYINLTTADINDKIRGVAESQRGHLTIETLLAMVDQRHLGTVFELHRLRVLTNSNLELSEWYISMLFREKAPFL